LPNLGDFLDRFAKICPNLLIFLIDLPKLCKSHGRFAKSCGFPSVFAQLAPQLLDLPGRLPKIAPGTPQTSLKENP